MLKILFNNYMKKNIFNYLRKNPEMNCYRCKKVCIWDNEVNPYFIERSFGFVYYENIVCVNCYKN